MRDPCTSSLAPLSLVVKIKEKLNMNFLNDKADDSRVGIRPGPIAAEDGPPWPHPAQTHTGRLGPARPARATGGGIAHACAARTAATHTRRSAPGWARTRPGLPT